MESSFHSIFVLCANFVMKIFALDKINASHYKPLANVGQVDRLIRQFYHEGREEREGSEDSPFAVTDSTDAGIETSAVRSPFREEFCSEPRCESAETHAGVNPRDDGRNTPA